MTLIRLEKYQSLHSNFFFCCFDSDLSPCEPTAFQQLYEWWCLPLGKKIWRLGTSHHENEASMVQFHQHHGRYGTIENGENITKSVSRSNIPMKIVYRASLPKGPPSPRGLSQGASPKEPPQGMFIPQRGHSPAPPRGLPKEPLQESSPKGPLPRDLPQGTFPLNRVKPNRCDEFLQSAPMSRWCWERFTS